jgi:hypothetical protein
VAALAILTDLAQEQLAADPELRAEQQRWTADAHLPAEGVPTDALGWVEHSPVPLRDFGGSPVRPPAPDLTAPAVVLVLATPTDDRPSWVRCGWALSEVLLRLTGEGVAATPLNQPLELHGLRASLRAAARVDGYPQMALRVGYPTSFGSPRTGRRPVEDVLSRS